MVDDDGQLLVFEVLVQQVAKLGGWPYQVHTDRQLAASHDSALDLGLGGLVGTDCVKNDVDEHAASP